MAEVECERRLEVEMRYRERESDRDRGMVAVLQKGIKVCLWALPCRLRLNTVAQQEANLRLLVLQ